MAPAETPLVNAAHSLGGAAGRVSSCQSTLPLMGPYRSCAAAVSPITMATDSRTNVQGIYWDFPEIAEIYSSTMFDG